MPPDIAYIFNCQETFSSRLTTHLLDDSYVAVSERLCETHKRKHPLTLMAGELFDLFRTSVEPLFGCHGNVSSANSEKLPLV